MPYTLKCITTGKTYSSEEIRYRGDDGGLLEAIHDAPDAEATRTLWNQRWRSQEFPFHSGVWRYRELVLPEAGQEIVTRNEGTTTLYPVGRINAKNHRYNTILGNYTNLDTLFLKHLGENPTGSFKDIGMTVAVTKGKQLGCTAVACASTGNTSAALASYAALAGMQAYVFIPEGNIAYGKLSQALAYGAKTLQIRGDFDDAMKLVEELCTNEGIYLVNSINPFRLEGQKTIAYEIAQQLSWQVPDWVVVPAGNLGNTSAIGKGFLELAAWGITNKVPRIASIQAAGANPFAQSFAENFSSFSPIHAETIATAIKIGNPVSYPKAVKIIQETNGVVTQVSDQDIMDAKANIDAAGIGCEPASACAVAGTKQLVARGIIQTHEHVVGILTGNLLKDPDATVNYHLDKLAGIQGTYANQPVVVDATIKGIKGAL